MDNVPYLLVRGNHSQLQESWAVYEKYAMGQDELRPLSLEGKMSFGGLSATLVDSLDTLWMMGLKPEFHRWQSFQ